MPDETTTPVSEEVTTVPEVKSWYTSRTIWGAIISMVAMAIGLTGRSMSQTDITALTDVATVVGTAIGTLLTVYGRVKATTPIGKKVQ